MPSTAYGAPIPVAVLLVVVVVLVVVGWTCLTTRAGLGVCGRACNRDEAVLAVPGKVVDVVAR